MVTYLSLWVLVYHLSFRISNFVVSTKLTLYFKLSICSGHWEEGDGGNGWCGEGLGSSFVAHHTFLKVLNAIEVGSPELNPVLGGLGILNLESFSDTWDGIQNNLEVLGGWHGLWSWFRNSGGVGFDVGSWNTESGGMSVCEFGSILNLPNVFRESTEVSTFWDLNGLQLCTACTLTELFSWAVCNTRAVWGLSWDESGEESLANEFHINLIFIKLCFDFD